MVLAEAVLRCLVTSCEFLCGNCLCGRSGSGANTTTEIRIKIQMLQSEAREELGEATAKRRRSQDESLPLSLKHVQWEPPLIHEKSISRKIFRYLVSNEKGFLNERNNERRSRHWSRRLCM